MAAAGTTQIIKTMLHFVTAPAVQALLLARKSGQEIPAEVFERSAKILLESRNENGAFQYSGTVNSRRKAKLPGSIARSAICEVTLLMLDKGDNEICRTPSMPFTSTGMNLKKDARKQGRTSLHTA